MKDQDLSAGAVMESPRPSRSRVFYTVQEAKAALDCSQQTVYRWLKQGKLRGGHGPGGVRVSRAEVDMIVQLVLEGKM